jgi:hypothetical protein
MSKEIVEGLENLSLNVEYIIDWLQDNKSEQKPVDANSIDFINNEINSFSGYLENIDSNVEALTNSFSGFLEGMSTEETINDTPEITQFNQSMLEMITKIDELKSSLDNLSVDLNLGIDKEELTRIQEEIQGSLDVKFDASYIENFVNNINTILTDINNIELDLNIDESIANIELLKENLESLNSLEIDSINLDVFKSDNIENIIADLESLNNLDIDLNIDTNIEDIIASLDSIKNINLNELNLESLSELSKLESLETLSDLNDLDLTGLQNLDLSNLESLSDLKDLDLSDLENLDKLNLDSLSELTKLKDLDLSNLEQLDLSNLNLDIDISKVVTDLDSVTEKLSNIDSFELELNIKDNTTAIIDKLKSDINDISESFSVLNVDANVNIIPTTESIDNLQSELDNQNLEITPTIDISSQIEDLNNKEFDIKINPIVNLDDVTIESNLSTLDTIKPDNTKEKEQAVLVSYLEKNNEVLSELANAIKGMGTTTEVSTTEPLKVDAEKVEEDSETSIMNVEAPTQTPTTDMSSITPLLEQLVQTNIMIMKKLTKTGFNTDINF